MHYISTEHLTPERVQQIINDGEHLALSDEAKAAILRCREYLDRKMEDIDHPVYGVTTGFGSLRNITIPAEDLSQLQHNLVVSHACGTGDRVNSEIVKFSYLKQTSMLKLMIRLPL